MSSGSLNKLPLEMQDGGLIRQQFYHALAVHSMAEQLKGVVRAVVAEKEKLLHMSREGALMACMHTCSRLWRSKSSDFHSALHVHWHGRGNRRHGQRKGSRSRACFAWYMNATRGAE